MLAIVFALSVLLTGCAGLGPDTGPAAGPSPLPSPAGREHPVDLSSDRPPPVTVTAGDRSVRLDAWTFCYGNLCADGFPPENLADLGNAGEVIVEFPIEGWTFQASFVPAGASCGREQTVDLEPAGDGRFRLTPAGSPGTYDVTLFGRGAGDLFVSFRWTTPYQGPLVEPVATLAVLADHDGAVDSYGVELSLAHLRSTPADASARITVTEAGGASVSFDAIRAEGHCRPEGSLYWDGPDQKGLEAARLGAGPFTYDVVVVLDGVRYTASAAWPADELPDYGPSVGLDFTPPLPALT